MDRGGIKHISDRVYMLLCSMEKEFRHHIPQFTSENEEIIDTVAQRIMENDDIIFYWSVIAANWEPQEAAVLLRASEQASTLLYSQSNINNNSP